MVNFVQENWKHGAQNLAHWFILIQTATVDKEIKEIPFNHRRNIDF